MPTWHVYAAGVNMAATIDDTQDLSTIRGSGLALLGMPDQIDALLNDPTADLPGITPNQTTKVFVGASEGLWRVTVSDPDAATKLAENLTAKLLETDSPSPTPLALALRHMRVLISARPAEDPGDEGGERAIAAARFAQFRRATVPIPPHASKTHCALDRVRPATHQVKRGDTTLDVSPAAKVRRDYGRHQKHAFYTSQGVPLWNTVRKVTDTFNEMVEDPPEDTREAVKGKLALLYADGNGFGDIRQALAVTLGPETALTTFSEDLLDKRKALLNSVLSWFQDQERAPNGARRALWYPKGHSVENTDCRLRFETLLWGGDEMIWVMPAWAGWDVLAHLFAETRNWTLKGHRLTHAAGLVFFQAKTPIRIVKALAHDLVDSAKQVAKVDDMRRNVCQVLPIESHDIPAGFLDRYRTTVFGARTYDPEAEAWATDPTAFTLDGDTFDTLTDHLRNRVLGGFPPSQLFGLLREAAARDWLRFESPEVKAWRDKNPGEDAGPLAKTLREILNAGGYGAGPGRAALTMIDFMPDPEHPAGPPTLPATVQGQRHTPLALAHLALLWDYIDPFGEWS